MPVKMLKKNTVGEVVNRDMMSVNMNETISNSHRISLASQEDALAKVKDSGKEESKLILVIPFRSVLSKFRCSPVSDTTPQPPTVLSIMPAWIADPQMNESPRYIGIPCGSSCRGPPITNGL